MLTRRGFLGGTLGGAALLGLAACGDSQPTGTDRRTSTRAVQTMHGQVEVPTAPKRVVTVSFVGTANLLDLGITPVAGVTSGVEFLPEYQDKLKGMPIVADAAGKVELEAIAAAEPDLIVGSDWTDPSQALLPYDKLTAIAPTALFAQAASVGNWPEQARGYAAAVNWLSQLTPLRGSLTAEQARIRQTYRQLLSTQRWALVNAGQDGWYRYSAQASHAKVLAGAGVRLTDASTQQKAAFEQLSFEQLGQLDGADVIGLGRAADTAWQHKLTSQRLFSGLPAVRDGHLYPMKWFFPSSYRTALALLNQIDPILRDWKDAR